MTFACNNLRLCQSPMAPSRCAEQSARCCVLQEPPQPPRSQGMAQDSAGSSFFGRSSHMTATLDRLEEEDGQERPESAASAVASYMVRTQALIRQESLTVPVPETDRAACQRQCRALSRLQATVCISAGSLILQISRPTCAASFLEYICRAFAVVSYVSRLHCTMVGTTPVMRSSRHPSSRRQSMPQQRAAQLRTAACPPARVLRLRAKSPPKASASPLCRRSRSHGR